MKPFFQWTGPERHRTFLSVQALRGIAAILVVIFHAGLRFDPTEQTFRVGNAGVDIFFVISGFVMTTVTAGLPADPRGFLRKRCIRLVPLYWLATLAMITAWAIMPGAFPRMQPTAAHVLLSLAFVPHRSPDSGLIQPILGQGWTLNFEIFFYILFAAALLLPARRRLPAIMATLGILPLLGYVARIPAIAPTDLLNPLLIEFLAGIALARFVAIGVRAPVGACWAFVALGVAMLVVAAPPADDDLSRLLQYGVPASLIVGGAIGAECAGSVQVGGWLRLLGDASYSIYLSHTFVVSMLGKLWPAALGSMCFIITATLLAVLVGVLVYWIVESPLLAALRRRGVPAWAWRHAQEKSGV